METRPYWDFEKDDMLIDLVKSKPELYDRKSCHYNDSIFKKMLWTDIETQLQMPEAKNRWEQLRSQYRKYLSKLKIKEKRPSARILKWRFYDKMKFIDNYQNSKSKVSSTLTNSFDDSTCDIEFEALDNTEDIKSMLPKINDENEKIDKQDDSVNPIDNSTPTASKINDSDESVPRENALSLSRKYGSIKKKKHKHRRVHPMEQFFSLMAATVKHFSPKDQYRIKKSVFTLVCHMEEKYVTSYDKPFSPTGNHKLSLRSRGSVSETSSSSSSENS